MEKNYIKIAIIGKPNVGKSSLFNRLVSKKKAIISDIPGTTRDKIMEKIDLDGYPVELIDTGGLFHGKKDNIEKDVELQATIAIEEADIIIFLLDLTNPLSKDDFLVTNILRKSKNKNILLVINKIDNQKSNNYLSDIYELGFGEGLKISTIHNSGIEELKNSILKLIKKSKFKIKKIKREESSTINICIIGKPNSGKSSLINAITGENRLIVSEIPGTTRDSIDIDLKYKESKFKLIDTAGIRKKGKIEKGIEKYSLLRTVDNIQRSDICILLIDASVGISSQDCHITEYILNERKGLIIALNKEDLLEPEDKKRLLKDVKDKFDFIPWAPSLFISALRRKKIMDLLNYSLKIIEEKHKRVSTSELNQFFQKIIHKHPPSSHNLRRPKFMYATQSDTNPPVFTIFFKNPENLHFSYVRYIENELRKAFKFSGTAIELKFKKS